MKLKLLAVSLLCTQVYAISVMPEVRTTVSVSKTDINRISCQNGAISSVDYAANTGLTHNTHQNKKNIVILFQQLDDGRTRQIINSKVNMLIGCNDEYYPLILDPQEVDSQSIFLQTSKLERQARKSKQKNIDKTYDQILIDLIKDARKGVNDGVVIEKTSIYIDDVQVKLLNKNNIPGTGYQLNKFAIISNKEVDLSEKIFLDTRLSKHPIIAISIDDFKLSDEKNWTNLYLIVDNGGFQ